MLHSLRRCADSDIILESKDFVIVASICRRCVFFADAHVIHIIRVTHYLAVCVIGAKTIFVITDIGWNFAIILCIVKYAAVLVKEMKEILEDIQLKENVSYQ